jgi:hypothetical protein
LLAFGYRIEIAHRLCPPLRWRVPPFPQIRASLLDAKGGITL